MFEHDQRACGGRTWSEQLQREYDGRGLAFLARAITTRLAGRGPLNFVSSLGLARGAMPCCLVGTHAMITRGAGDAVRGGLVREPSEFSGLVGEHASAFKGAVGSGVGADGFSHVLGSGSITCMALDTPWPAAAW